MSIIAGPYLLLPCAGSGQRAFCYDVLDRPTLAPLGQCTLLETSQPWERPHHYRLAIDTQADLPVLRRAILRRWNDAAIITLDDGSVIDTSKPSPETEALLRAALPHAQGMTGTTDRPGCFYLRTAEDFAYVLNLRPRCDGLQVEAGFTFPGSWEHLAALGEMDTGIRLRVIRQVNTEDELRTALAEADALRDAWIGQPREAVRAHIAEQQKAFLQRITAQLKPLGFRKKAANWVFQRGDGYEVVWNAQKSAYSDGYYFNLYLHRAGMKELYGCISRRPMGALLDWQSTPHTDFDDLLRAVIQRNIRPLMTLPLEEIARQPDRFGRPDICTPRRCPDCWYPEST